MTRAATTVQDGHSGTEQAVYKAVWARGADIGPDCRRSSASQAEVARELALHPNTVRRALRSLAEKLALQEVEPADPATSAPKTYLVYSYRAILKRRRAAGLTWASRKHGVRLLPDALGRPAANGSSKARLGISAQSSSPASPFSANPCVPPIAGSSDAQDLTWWRDALWEYVSTDRAGHTRREPEPPTRPDDEITRRVAEACGWDRSAAAAALMRLKRRGIAPESYGYFPAVLPKVIGFANRSANASKSGLREAGRLQAGHGRLDTPNRAPSAGTVAAPNGVTEPEIATAKEAACVAKSRQNIGVLGPGISPMSSQAHENQALQSQDPGSARPDGDGPTTDSGTRRDGSSSLAEIMQAMKRRGFDLRGIVGENGGAD